MTVTCFPVNAAAGAPLFTAQQTRQALSALFAKPSNRPMGAYSGRASATDLLITVAGTTINVGPGAAIIDPAFTVNGGAYLYASDAVQTLAQNAPHATLPRTDIVFITINDTDIDGSGLRVPTLGYLAGVAAASPAQPATPARSLLLAHLNVPASGGGGASVAMNSFYSAAAGGVLPIPSGLWYPPSPSDSQMVYRQDANRVEAFNGATWDIIGPPAAGLDLGSVGGSPDAMTTTGTAYGAWTGIGTGLLTVEMVAAVNVIRQTFTATSGGSGAAPALVSSRLRINGSWTPWGKIAPNPVIQTGTFTLTFNNNVSTPATSVNFATNFTGTPVVTINVAPFTNNAPLRFGVWGQAFNGFDAMASYTSVLTGSVPCQYIAVL